MSVDLAEDCDLHRRRLLYRSTHRGGKELDMILGTFAQSQLPTMTFLQLQAFEALLDLDDTQLKILFLEQEKEASALQSPLPSHGVDVYTGVSSCIDLIRAFVKTYHDHALSL